ncbi:hypothetical protein Anas_03182 [Armadillidium nasatum]|uniref:Ion transport domain-containing protein n=1 Tax=Armadillidium nasatum TaxID=96803 RepID=A0A5N5SWF7_9CRUS|nr:hypothetical protein Anas_03182 [Armadillidium nasatum]
MKAVLLLMLHFHNQSQFQKAILHNMNIVFTSLFTIECILKILAFGFRNYILSKYIIRLRSAPSIGSNRHRSALRVRKERLVHHPIEESTDFSLSLSDYTLRVGLIKRHEALSSVEKRGNSTFNITFIIMNLQLFLSPFV